MGYWRLFYHIVWATKSRQWLITPDIEWELHSHIAARATLAGGKVYAVNGMEDHIHLVAAVPPGKSLSSFIGTVKGSTSHLLILRARDSV